MMDGNDSDSFIFSLSITPIVCYLEESEGILDADATYHACPEKEWFATFEKLEKDLVSFGDGHMLYERDRCNSHQVVNWDGERVKGCRYVPQLKNM